MKLLATIHPRKGRWIARWSPLIARQIDMLYTLGLIDWEIEDGMGLLTLTPRGRAARLKVG